MPHKHSYAKTIERRLRAEARGYVQTCTPVGARGDASQGVLRWLDRRSYLPRLRLVDMALKAQLMVSAAFGNSIDGLGRTYQQVRCLDNGPVTKSLKVLNSITNTIRHHPLLPLPLVTVPMNFLYLLDQALTKMIVAVPTLRWTPKVRVLSLVNSIPLRGHAEHKNSKM